MTAHNHGHDHPHDHDHDHDHPHDHGHDHDHDHGHDHGHQHQRDDHNWHSDNYVDSWILRDAARDAARRQLLQQMMVLAPFPANAPLRVLDVGGGYGLVTDEVMRRYPSAHVTLQDYSAPMLERAKVGLKKYGDHVSFAQSDLTDPAWKGGVGGPFDLTVSAIALHNLRDLKVIASSYGAIYELLAPNGVFLNCDHFDRAGGLDAHLRALEKVGFHAECAWQNDRDAIVKATK